LRVLPNERGPNERGPNEASGTPLPTVGASKPPVIRRAEVVAFALVALLVICVVAVLYAAKAFFLPVVMAFVVGTMLSRPRISRTTSHSPLGVGGFDRDGGGRRRRLYRRPDLLAVDGMEQPPAGIGIAAEG